MADVADDQSNRAKYQNWIRADQRALDKWRLRHPGQMLDGAGMDLSNANLQSRNLSYIDFSGAIFRGALLQGASLEGAKLEHAIFEKARLANTNLKDADLAFANFSAAELQSANLTDAYFDKTRFDNALLQSAIISDRADMRNSTFSRSNLNQCNLRHVSFKGCDLSRARLQIADCSGACFDDANLDEAVFSESDLSECSLQRSSLKGTSLEAARLDRANLEGASLIETNVSGASFDGVIGLTRCLGLETVRTGATLPRYLDTAVVPIIDRILSWDRLRVVGRLPLFGVSYSALVLMPFLFYLLEMFNSRINQIRRVASSMSPDSASGHLARTLVEHLHTEPVPRLSFVLFVCTIVLATGATIYSILCPARIKEFSKDQWQDQLDRSLILYLPFSWKHRGARLACAACYTVGGGGVLFVLLTKIFGALVYLARAEVG